jgi:hypothetical protein
MASTGKGHDRPPEKGGNSGREAMRILKRRLSNAVFQALLHDQTDALIPAA